MRSCVHRMIAALPSRLFVLALAAPFALAQVPPGVEPPPDAGLLDAEWKAPEPAFARLDAARQALGKGDRAGAIPHLLAALEFRPASPLVLLELVRAQEEADAKALWSWRYAVAATDARGKVEPDAASKKLFVPAELALLQKVAGLRALAAAELAKASERGKPGAGTSALGNGAVARFLATVFDEVAGDSPQLLRAHASNVHKAFAGHAPDLDAIGKALLQVAQGQFGQGASFGAGVATATGKDADAARLELQLAAARILAGLARQANFGKDLLGFDPGPLKQQAAAAAAAREAIERALPAPRVWTVDELRALDPAAQKAFTLAHRSWASPGVATSPTGKYRIETVCGHETLLGVAETVELHHARLVAHYGADPFEGRKGTVLIVPEVHEMETEGLPFWWAGGFQGGDRTVLRFAWGDVPGLGRGLTHELTHRFDGVLRPFLRAWYGEGHASWTGGHYGPMTDADFTEDHLDLGACMRTLQKGYGEAEGLKRLLRGELDEYRDNYFAGYALYAFLRGYPPDAPPKYRSALQRFEEGARAGQSDPVGWFEKAICDGKDGRAKGFDAFVVEWRAFLDGIARWLDEKRRGPDVAWVAAYGPMAAGEIGKLVRDEFTWSWARARAEPFFGQGHARAAADVLRDAGHPAAAAAAYLWSLAVEGFEADTGERLVPLLHQTGRAEAAAAVAALARSRAPTRVPASAVGEALLAKLPRTKALLDGLVAAAAALGDTRPLARAEVLAEHERIAAWFGLPAADGAALALPAPSVPRTLLAHGLVDDRRVEYDEGRVDGLWFASPDGDLFVGRDRASSATGLERESPHRNVFVRTQEWLPPGDHVLRLRVHLTTAFVEGAFVVGHWRRDRGVRIGFAAGDPEFASGRKDAQIATDRVAVRLEGRWERDGRLPRTSQATTIEFGATRPSFEVEIAVKGPLVVVRIEGQEAFRYTAHDGEPVEGHFGFAASRGAYRVQQPTIERRDLSLPGQALGAVAGAGLDVARAATVPVEDLLGLPVRGLPVGEVGTLVLWLPPVAADDTLDRRLPRTLPLLAKWMTEAVDFPQPWVLALPDTADTKQLEAVRKAIAEVRKEPMPEVRHRVSAPFDGGPWVLFVDSKGILRGANQVGDAELFAVVESWARMFRDR